MPFIHTFPEFCSEMKCAHKYIRGRELFSNGAQWAHGEYKGTGWGEGPPKDTVKCLVLRLEFQRFVCKEAEDNFNAHKNYLATQSQSALTSPSYCPSPSNEETEMLSTLRETVLKERKKLDAIRDEVAALKKKQGPTDHENHQKSQQEHRMRALEVQSRVARINI